MTYSQITRLLNWSAIAIALSLMALVSYQLYLRHFVQQTTSLNYQFDDLPGTAEVPLTVNIDEIIDKHVFGVVPEVLKTNESEVAKVVTKPAPKTRLNIKLTGIIDGSTSQNGMAMMEVDRGRTIVVAVGENINKTDAVLHQVLPGEILIDRGGTIESVKMVRKTLSIAKLESELLDSLPQPYTESQNPELYQRPESNTTPAPRRRSMSSSTGQAKTTAGQEDTNTSENNGYARPTPPALRRTINEPMNALPIPRMLR